MLRNRNIIKIKGLYIADNRDLIIKTVEGKFLVMDIIYREGNNSIIWKEIKIKGTDDE